MIDYSAKLKKGLLYTVKVILEEIRQNNLDYNILMTLDNAHPDSLISIRLKELYPNEMCISLSNNYEDLEVKGNYFQVKLDFNGFDEKLRIPFSTIIKFEDVDVGFSIDLTAVENFKKDDFLVIEHNIININFDKK